MKVNLLLQLIARHRDRKTVQNLMEVANVGDKTDMCWPQNMHMTSINILFNVLH